MVFIGYVVDPSPRGLHMSPTRRTPAGQLVREVCSGLDAHHGGSPVAGPCRTRSWYAASVGRERGEGAEGGRPGAAVRVPAERAAPGRHLEDDTVRSSTSVVPSPMPYAVPSPIPRFRAPCPIRFSALYPSSETYTLYGSDPEFRLICRASIMAPQYIISLAAVIGAGPLKAMIAQCA